MMFLMILPSIPVCFFFVKSFYVTYFELRNYIPWIAVNTNRMNDLEITIERPGTS
jgi:hypothetical protein